MGRRPYFSQHIHMEYSDWWNREFGASQAAVIVQTRDLFDTVVSAKEHIDREPIQPWLPIDSQGWERLSDEDRFRAVAHYYAPWHLKFQASWSRFPRACHLTYGELFADPHAAITDICRFAGVSVSSGRIEEALGRAASDPKSTRRNVGEIGRGRSVLPADVINRLQELLAVDAELGRSVRG